jgi:hypothetical protein
MQAIKYEKISRPLFKEIRMELTGWRLAVCLNHGQYPAEKRLAVLVPDHVCV